MDKNIKSYGEDIKYTKYRVLGAYIFDNIYESNGEDEEVRCQVLVFEHLKYAFEEFLDSLEDIFKDFNYDSFNIDEEINNLIPIVKKKFFEGYDLFIGYKDIDIYEILYYYSESGDIPKFTEIEYESNSDMNITIEIEGPNIIKPPTNYEKMSMGQLRKISPEYWRKLRDSVFEKFLDEEGYYVSATGLYKSKSRLYFQIDHIIPMAHGGKTRLDNLQLLTRWENTIKGTKTQEEFMKEIREYNYWNSDTVCNLEELEEILINTFQHEETVDNAKDIAKQILLRDASNIVALNVQGRISLIEGKYRSALINANKVLEKDRINAYALYTKGFAYFEKEKYEDAIKNFELAVKLEPCFEGYRCLGDCNFKLKKKDISLGYYSKAIEFQYENKEVVNEDVLVNIYFNIGQIYFSKRKYEFSLKYFNEAFKIDSEHHYAINNVGVCFERMGRFNEALEHYKRAYEINPEHKLYKNNISKLEKKIGS